MPRVRSLSIAVALLALAPAAFARILTNTIDSSAVVTDDGRQLILTGPITQSLEQLGVREPSQCIRHGDLTGPRGEVLTE